MLSPIDEQTFNHLKDKNIIEDDVAFNEFKTILNDRANTHPKKSNHCEIGLFALGILTANISVFGISASLMLVNWIFGCVSLFVYLLSLIQITIKFTKPQSFIFNVLWSYISIIFTIIQSTIIINMIPNSDATQQFLYIYVPSIVFDLLIYVKCKPLLVLSLNLFLTLMSSTYFLLEIGGLPMKPENVILGFSSLWIVTMTFYYVLQFLNKKQIMWIINISSFLQYGAFAFILDIPGVTQLDHWISFFLGSLAFGAFGLKVVDGGVPFLLSLLSVFICVMKIAFDIFDLLPQGVLQNILRFAFTGILSIIFIVLATKSNQIIHHFKLKHHKKKIDQQIKIKSINV
jgi:hypothetical protein